MERVIRGSRTTVLEPVIRCMCGKVARAFLQIHAADQCKDQMTTSQFFCSDCAIRHLEIAQEVADYGTESCRTCGLAFVTLSDIIVRICHIDKR